MVKIKQMINEKKSNMKKKEGIKIKERRKGNKIGDRSKGRKL